MTIITKIHKIQKPNRPSQRILKTVLNFANTVFFCFIFAVSPSAAEFLRFKVETQNESQLFITYDADKVQVISNTNDVEIRDAIVEFYLSSNNLKTPVHIVSSQEKSNIANLIKVKKVNGMTMLGFKYGENIVARFSFKSENFTPSSFKTSISGVLEDKMPTLEIAEDIEHRLPAAVSNVVVYSTPFSTLQSSIKNSLPQLYTPKAREIIPIKPLISLRELFPRGSRYSLDVVPESDPLFNSYIQITSINPNDTEVYMKRGISCYLLGNYQGAIENLSQVIKVNPNHVLAHKIRGDIYVVQGHYKQALKDYDESIGIEKSLNTDPKDMAESLFMRAFIVFAAYPGDGMAIGAMMTNYEAAIQLNPNYAEAYYNRGSIYLANRYLDNRNLDRAIEDFNQALRINPNFAAVYYVLGTILTEFARPDFRQDDYQRAIIAFNQAIRINPNYVWVYKSRGDVYQLLKNYQQAINEYSQAIRIDPKLAEAYWDRGRTFARLGNKTEAISDLETAAALFREQLDPNSQELRSKLTFIQNQIQEVQEGKFEKN
jgi:tetratricopeptide (TPR) repeat protein